MSQDLSIFIGYWLVEGALVFIHSLCLEDSYCLVYWMVLLLQRFLLDGNLMALEFQGLCTHQDRCLVMVSLGTVSSSLFPDGWILG